MFKCHVKSQKCQVLCKMVHPVDWNMDLKKVLKESASFESSEQENNCYLSAHCD